MDGKGLERKGREGDREVGAERERERWRKGELGLRGREG